MKKQYLAVIALSGLVLAAQDHSATLLYSTAKHNNLNVSGSELTADNYKGLGLRYGQTAGKAFGARLDFEGTWKLRTSGQDLKQDGTVAPGITMHQESMGLGLAATWTKVIDFGAALEVRHENTSLHYDTGSAVINFDQTAVRPWLGLRVGYTLATKSVKPTFGFEYALPLATKRGSSDSLVMYDLGRLMRPTSELSLTAGVRF